MGVRYCPPLPAHHQRRKRIAERIRSTLLALTTIGVLNAAFPAQADGAFVDLPQDLEIELALNALPGDLQAEAIRNKYTGLLKRLCEHHANWCLAK